MSANRKVVLIVVLGIGACLLSFLLSRYFLEKDHTNQLTLSHIQQATGRIEYIRLLGKTFIQTASEANWQQIINEMKSIRGYLGMIPSSAEQWRREREALDRSLDTYHQILTKLYEPARSLKKEKEALQGIGLSFSKEVEEKIIEPYRKEEGKRLYNGEAFDPFKARVKDTAYDLVALHTKQQLILFELLLNSDLNAYKQKKEVLSEALAKNKARLRFMNVLMGNEPSIQAVIDSVNQKLTDLVGHEQSIIEYFSVLSKLEARLNTTGMSLMAAGRDLSDKIVADTVHDSHLYGTLNWSLLLGLVGGLGLLGAMLGRDIIRFVHDLKGTQKELKESEDNLKVTLYSIGDAVIATDADGSITRMNPLAEQLTGWMSVEAVGMPLPEVFHIVNGRTRKRVSNPVEKVLAKGEIVGLANDTILIARNGIEYQIADSGAPIRHSGGGIIGVVLVFRDVTEAYIQEQKIRESEKLLKSITANVPGVVCQFNVAADNTYHVHFVSEKATDIFGLNVPTDRFLTELNVRLSEKDQERMEVSLQESIDNMSPWHWEGHFNKPSGESIWVSGSAIPHMEGDSVFFYSMFLDITQRKRAEEALRKYEQIVSTSQDRMALINTDYVYEAVNESFLRSRRKSRDEVVGRTVAQVMGENVFREKLQPWLDQAFSGQTVHHRDTFDHPIGGRKTMEVTLFPMMDAKGHVDGVVLNVRDITETRKLEEQLVQSQKIESIGTLASGVAHEINNPINGIMNYAQLILDRTGKENSSREFAQKIVHETKRIAEIVRNLLTFARHEKYSHSPARLNDIISSVLSLIQTVMRHDQIDLQLEIPEDLPKLKCRSQQIQQVLMNLMTNARDALNERFPGYDPGKRLRVSVRSIEKEQRKYLRTTVEDSGPGIPMKIRDRIFDPFFTTKPKETGTGLGLSISYGIVRDHGGELSVESEPGRYTRFHVDLPVNNGWTLTDKKEM